LYVILANVKGVLALALFGACSFDHSVAPRDSSPDPDVEPDMLAVTWAVDSMSKKAVPATAAEWSDFAQAFSVTTPEHAWLMQETTGSLQDSIGTISLDPQNGPSHRNAVSGWSRLAIGTSDTDADQGFFTTATGNLNGGSYLLLLYVAVLAPPTEERSLAGIGAATDHRYVAVTTAPVFKATGSGVSPTTGMVNAMATVHPIVLKIDTGQLAYVVYTDQEKLSVPWRNTVGTGGLLMIGNAITGAAPARYLYGALWEGAKAQLDDGKVKALLTGLGWTVSGY
jgi:hypothetical protein